MRRMGETMGTLPTTRKQQLSWFRISARSDEGTDKTTPESIIPPYGSRASSFELKMRNLFTFAWGGDIRFNFGQRRSPPKAHVDIQAFHSRIAHWTAGLEHADDCCILASPVLTVLAKR